MTKTEYQKQYRQANKEKAKEYMKSYYLKNKEQLNTKNLKNYTDNKERYNQFMKNYYIEHKDKMKEGFKEYYQNNKERWIPNDKNRASNNAYRKRRYKNDPHFRLKISLRTRVTKALKNKQKLNKSIELLGCTIEFYKLYLESKFQSGMTWENYGKNEDGTRLNTWDIDHIKPCCTFDLSNEEQQKQCFNYINTQPLWNKENLDKRLTDNQTYE